MNRQVMNALFALCLSAAGGSLSGCDPLAESEMGDGNRFTDMNDMLKRFDKPEGVSWLGPDGTLPGMARSVLAGDLNGDGRDDILVHYSSVLNVVQIGIAGDLALGLTFDWLEPVASPAYGAIGIVDTNNDGVADLITADVFSGEVRTYLVESAPSQAGPQWRVRAQAAREIAGPSGGTGICHPNGFIGFVDANRDGVADLVCYESKEDTNRKLIAYLSKADGTFEPVSSEASCLACSTFTKVPQLDELWRFGDFDKDGNTDIVVMSPFAPGAFVSFGDGAGHFGSRREVTTGGTNTFSPLVGDFDGDGLRDLFSRTFIHYGAADRKFSRAQEVILQLAQGVPLASYSYSAPHRIGSWAEADLDGDGMDDVAGAGWDPDFGATGPAFLRVVLGGEEQASFASNTKLDMVMTTTTDDPAYPVALSAQPLILAGHFKAEKAAEQLLVLDSRTNEYTFYEWQK